MKIYYIPAKDKNTPYSSIQLNSISALALATGSLVPKTIQVKEFINDINGVREIKTVYYDPTASSFGIREVVLIIIVVAGVYYIRKIFLSNQSEKDGIDMSFFKKDNSN